MVIHVVPAPVYPANAMWIQDTGWVGAQQNILTTNLPKLINDLAANHITHALIQVAWWDSTDPTHPTICIGEGQPGMLHDSAFYQNVVDQLHAVGIKAIAWFGNLYGYPGGGGPQKSQPPAPATKIMDITTANRQNVINAIVSVMSNELAAWDGYSDDVETFVGDTGSWLDQLPFYNALTPALHAIGKLNMPATPLDWQQIYNMNLYVDYACSMFYDGGSALETDSAAALWQENFGMYQGQNTPPTSPILLGLRIDSTSHSVAWQLNECAKYIALYGAPQLAGFCLWEYEYMGETLAADDWAEWKYWIDNIGTSTPPVAKHITVQSTPLNVPMILENKTIQVPYTWLAFLGSITVTAPPSAKAYQHTPLQVAPTPAGKTSFGGTGISGPSGYHIWTYFNGPYTLTAATPPLSTINFYSHVAGIVKIAIYDGRSYPDPVNPDGSVVGPFPGGNYPHPNNEIVESQPFNCKVGWNSIPMAIPPLPAPGPYFIGIKTEVNGMMSGSPAGGFWGNGQVMEGDLTVPFPATYPESALLGGVGGEFACYIPIGPIVEVDYAFTKWEDGSTNPTRTIPVTADRTVTATYTSGPISLTANADGPYSAHVNNPTVQFAGSVTGGTPPYTWLWDFGDGATSALQNPSHIYPTTTATWTVTLTVTDSVGVSSSSSSTVTISTLQPPLASFTYTPSTPTVGQSVAFDGSASHAQEPDATLTSYAWDFGDGSTASGASATHVYAQIGTYTVKLTVTDSNGTQASITQSVTVKPTPTPPTAFDNWWAGVEEFFKRLGWPVPPKPPQPPSLPGQ